MNMGVAGLGRIGRMHFQNIIRQVHGARVVAVADPLEEARAFAAGEGVTAYASFEALLDHADLDAVVICSPTDEHAGHVMAAARRGKHVFCEKPLDLSPDRVREALAVVEETGIDLMLGFNRRFDASFAKVKSVVAEGRVGEVHIIRITSRDPAPPPLEFIKHSGGLFLDMTIHDFDMARHLMGCEVTEVYARGANLLDSSIGEAGDIDTAVCILSFENGATAVIDNSRQAVYGYDQRLEVFGTKGVVSIDNETADRHCLATADGVQGPLPHPFFLERYAAAYLAEMQAFVDAVREHREMPVNGHDGLMALMIGLAARESVRENRPIKVKF